MQAYKPIKTYPLTDFERIKRPDAAEILGLDSPASEIFTDFLVQTPFVLEYTVPVNDAREMMKKTHVRLKLIVDDQERFKGVVTAADLVSIKVTQARNRTGLAVDELTVGDVMTPRAKLHAIAHSDIARAKIGEVLATMRQYGEQHVLVVDAEERAVRGIILPVRYTLR